jgi:hypothetical protein
MVDTSRYVSVLGESPAIKWGALTSTAFGTVLYGWLQGWLAAFLEVWSGFNSALDDVAGFNVAFIANATYGVAAPLEAAFAANVAWLRTLGAFGIVVAAVEAVVLVWFLLGVTQATVRGISWAVS